MFACTSEWNCRKGLRRSALLLLWVATAVACATAPVAPKVQGPTSLSDLVVESQDGNTVVILNGLEDAVYNAFQQTDPARIVVDLASVTPGEVADAIAVYDGTVDEVSVEGFENEGARSTRIELSLATNADYEVVALEDRLEIHVRAADRQDTLGPEEGEIAETAIDGDPWAQMAGAEDAGAAAAGVEESAAAGSPEDSTAQGNEPAELAMATSPASVLLGVTAEGSADSVQALLEADGSIEGATWFSLEDPTRLVLDLPGLRSAVPEPRIELGGEWIQRIRIGQHEDKVRVVFDGTPAADFEEARIVTVPSGLWLGLGEAPAPMTDVAAKPIEGEAAPNFEPAAQTDEVAESGADPNFTMLGEQTRVDGQLAAVDSEGVSEGEAPVAIEGAQVPTAVGEERASAVLDDAQGPADLAMEAPVELAMAEPALAEEPTETVAAESSASAEPENEFEAKPEEASAPEPQVSDSESSGIADALVVYGVQFESEENTDRVVIVTEGPAEYVTTHPEADTTVVSLRGARIDPDATVRVVPDQPRVVSLVNAFQQPGVREPEVRVVVKAAEGVMPTVVQQGAILRLEYPEGATTAQALPMMPGGTEQASAPASIDPGADSVDILAEGGLVNGKKYTGRRISLDFKDVEIDDVLRLIAEVSDLNIIAGDEVNGKVTIRLVDVPWDQALDVILLTRGLGFVRVGSVLRIAPSEVLKAEEEARLQERRAKEKLEDLVVKLQPVNYANVKEIEKMVKRLLTPRGSVDVDERTNTVILKDIASVIDEATALIKAIDTQTPQVMIEAKIVEANLDFGKELGAVWGLGVQPLTDGFDDTSAVRRDERLGLGNDVVFHEDSSIIGDGLNLNNVSVSNPISSVANGLLNVGAFILDERFNVEVQIQAAESYGEGKVVSSPRIVTLDNRKASIEQGVSIPFQTFENGDAKLEFIDAVLRLDVTPHITADKSIIMKIEVQRNAPDDSVQTPTGSPAIAKNEAETETLVKDGQTLVIGGIYVVDQSETESRVPYFHKIPLLGNAFKNSEVRDIRKELLVFVTPRIVINPELGS